MRSTNAKELRPLILLFVVLNAVFIAGRAWLEKGGADQEVLIWGNLFLFAVTLISFWLAKRGLNNANPNAFVRSIYASMMVKLFAFIIAAVIYIAIYRKGLNKPAFFTLMGLYLVYTFTEVYVLTRLLKGKQHG